MNRIILSLLISTLCGAAGAAVLQVPADYPTIQGAVNAAQDGDEIQIVEGVYFETISISSRNNLTLAGKRKVIIDANGGGPGLLVAFSTGVTLKNLRVRNCAGNAAISLVACGQIRVDRCRVSGVQGAGGIEVAGCLGVTIDRCRVKDVALTGVDINAGGTVVRRTRITAPGKHGIQIWGGANSAIDNRITAAGEDGIVLGGDGGSCNAALLAGNRIDLSGSKGIRFTEFASACYAFDNHIHGGPTGLYVQVSSDQHVLDGNIVRKTATRGLLLDGTDCLISRNNLKKGGAIAGFTIAGDNNILSENRIRKMTTYGVEIYACTGNAVIGNTVTGSGNFDLDDDTNPGDNSFVDNVFGTVKP